MEERIDRLWTKSFISACAANFLMGFSFFLLMPTLPFYIIERFHAPTGLVGVVLSIYVIAALAIRPFSGYFLDKFSRKQIYLLSYIFFVAFYTGYIIAGSLAMLIILRVAHGFTWGTITTSGNTLAIDIMPASKRGDGLGYYGMAINVSMAIGPVAGLFLYNHYPFDYIFYAATLSGLLGMAAAAIIKSPERIHFEHQQTVSLDRFILLKGLPISLNVILVAVSYGMLLSFAALFGNEIHVEHTGMFFIFLALGIGGSRVFSGRLIDKGKLHQVSALGLTILAVSFTIFSISRTEFLYNFSALAIGVGFGIMFPAFQFLFIDIATHHQRGTANSTYYTSFDVGVGMGMILAGKIGGILNLAWAFGFGAFLNLLAVIYYLRISKVSYEKNRIR